MIAVNQISFQTDDCGLDEAVEPLASYICAADRPEAAMETVLASLLRQVEQTNRAARTCVATFSDGRVATSA